MSSWSDDLIATIRPGQLIMGRYVIRDCIGTGELGVVYRCSCLADPSEFRALKVLRPDAYKQPELRARFRNEILISERVRHQNVVHYHEFLQSDAFEAFSMECIEGGTLHDLIASGEKLEISEIVRILCQLCEGLAAIHHAGFIHRDIKPRNLLMTKSRDIKIADFNTAVPVAHRHRRRELLAIGTLEYMSPEILVDGRADVRSDIYSWGVIAYQLVTGLLPFPFDNEDEHIRRKLRGAFQSPQARRPDCPAALCAIIERSLDYRVKVRFRSVRDLQAALKSVFSPPRGKTIALLQRILPKWRR